MAKIFNKNKCLPLFLAMAAASAQAQWAPTRPVRLIVPFPPGGAVDVVGRIAASRMPERVGQQVVVDNRGGAYAIIGTELGAKAAPDGHTILIVAAGHTITPSVIKKLPYDPVKDFAAIGFIGSGAFVLVVGPQSPAKSVQDFVALAKAKPGYINYAHTGYGNVAHLSAELFKVMAGIDMQGIHYKGGGPALTDLIGGQINAFFAGLASSSALIRAGKVRALGVTTARRSASLPDVPSIAEAGSFGLAGYDVDGWYGILAPAATPQAAIQRYNRELNVLLNMPDVKERLLTAGIEASPSTPAEFQARITRDLTRWAEVVKKAKITVE